MRALNPIIVAALVLTLGAPALGASLTASYLHCGARQRTTLSGATEAVAAIGRVDALVLAGIDSAWADELTRAFAGTGVAEVGSMLGRTGGTDERTLLLWDRSQLQLRDEEIERVDLAAGAGPAPLLARMRDASGVDFTLVAASFEGAGGEARTLAALRLSELAEVEVEPIVLLANLDRGVSLDGSSRDGILGLLTDDRRYRWLRPRPLERTDCNLSYTAGVREFVFVAGGAKEWDFSVRNGADVEQWCERFSRPCCWAPPRCRTCGPWHLPMLVTIETAPPPAAPSAVGRELPSPTPGLSEKEQILERIGWLAAELEALRARVLALE